MTNRELNRELSELNDYSFLKDGFNLFKDMCLLLIVNFICKHSNIMWIAIVNALFFFFYALAFRINKNKKTSFKIEDVDDRIIEISQKMTSDNVKYLENCHNKEQTIASKVFIDIFYVGLILNILTQAIDKTMMSVMDAIYLLLVLLSLTCLSMLLMNKKFLSEFSKVRLKVIDEYYKAHDI